MNQEVFVITNPQHGWDCVCGVFSTREKANEYLKFIYDQNSGDMEEEMSLEEFIEEATYIIHETILK